MPDVTRDDLDRIEKKIDCLLVMLTGNGAPEKGVIVRLDRIEQWRGELDNRIATLSARVSQLVVAIILAALLFLGGVLTNSIIIGFAK